MEGFMKRFKISMYYFELSATFNAPVVKPYGMNLSAFGRSDFAASTRRNPT